MACWAHDGVAGADVEGVVALVLVRNSLHLVFLLLLRFLRLLVLLVAGGRSRLEWVLVGHCWMGGLSDALRRSR